MKAIGYCRASTDKQELSPEMQVAKIKAYATLHDIALVEIIVDKAKSGKNANREGFQRVLAKMQNGEADVVIASKLSRLGRNTVESLQFAEQVMRLGVRLLCTDETVDIDTPSGWLTYGIRSVFNEWERRETASRTRAALQYKKSINERIGTIPYGFDLVDNGKKSKRGGIIGIVPNETEQKVIRLMVTLRDQGLSFAKIAIALDEKGIPTKNKAAMWGGETVRRIIREHENEKANREAA